MLQRVVEYLRRDVMQDLCVLQVKIKRELIEPLFYPIEIIGITKGDKWLILRMLEILPLANQNL